MQLTAPSNTRITARPAHIKERLLSGITNPDLLGEAEKHNKWQSKTANLQKTTAVRLHQFTGDDCGRFASRNVSVRFNAEVNKSRFLFGANNWLLS